MHDANPPSGVPERPEKPLVPDSQGLASPDPTPDIPRTDPPPASPEGAGHPADSIQAAEQAIADAQVAARKVTQAATQATTLEVPDLGAAGTSANSDEIGMLDDVELEVRIELGRTRMLVEDVLRLSSDAVVELDKAAGDPVDIYVNGRRIARGEVLVLNENFCIRVSEIVDPQSRTG
ncbi:MAG: flagellar motor switch protein FliN [Planctomycetota bacterium]|nr:flagellar motor switch protein FliN [Planctomycetota bacterium]